MIYSTMSGNRAAGDESWPSTSHQSPWEAMRSGWLAIGRPRFVSANSVGNWRASDDNHKVGAESLLPLPLVPSSQAQAFWRSWGVKIEATKGHDKAVIELPS